MAEPRKLPFGAWPSPISADDVAQHGLRLGDVALDGDDLYWIEGRPHEGGRSVLVRCSRDGSIADVVPPGVSVRSRVHEYGGGAYLAASGTIFYSNFADQRIYRMDPASDAPAAITPVGAWRYADYAFDQRRERLICVREDHTRAGQEAASTLAAVAIDGTREPQVIASGFDFYSTPRVSPDGRLLAWLGWRHPNMPWDGTELWVGEFDAAGAVANARCIAGGAAESIYQPGWWPDGTLCFASDRTGFWQLYRADASRLETAQPVTSALPDAEFGRPQWVFGTACWAWAGAGLLVASYTVDGVWHLARIDVNTGRIDRLANGRSPGESLASDGRHAVAVLSGPEYPACVARIDLTSGDIAVLRSSAGAELDSASISVPQSITFPGTAGAPTHAFFYAPTNAAATAPDGESPPLIVISHGGPTSAASPAFNPAVQFWTTRGFGVVDVNYGGSSGFGRAYRDRLKGRWGIVDVGDCVAAARYLASTGAADPGRLVIRGGSAGGFTTLAALTFHPDVFKAGASYYGICDLEVLVGDTHKFEARYGDSLIGPYPGERARYRERSPIHYVDQLACPLILLQGAEDAVVPPNQAEMMAAAVRAKGLPVALLVFEGEQHGFRRAETIIRALEAELVFYGVVFGFEPAGEIPALVIDNDPRQRR